MKKFNKPYCLVVGLGRSGISMAKFLFSKGYNVIATDVDSSKAKIGKKLNKLGIKTQIGFHDQKVFNNASCIIPSPGVCLWSKFFKKAIKNKVAIKGELDIFAKYNKLPIIAITGTNGKSTSCVLIGHILKKHGMKPFIGGNLGTPLISQLMSKDKIDIIVVEVSSFQLDLAKEFKPDVAVLLNISCDHLDRYNNFKEYLDSKWSLFQNQTKDNKAVINFGVKDFQKQTKKINSEIFTFYPSLKNKKLIRLGAKISSKQIEFILKKEKIQLPIKKLKLDQLEGNHNLENIAASCLACLAIGIDLKNIESALKSFKGLSHRIEFVKSINKVRFYNDSKATNPDAVIKAIKRFKKNIILILGGKDKQTDFSYLVKDVQKSVKEIIAIGEAKPKIKKVFNSICPVNSVTNMEQAVKKALSIADRKDVVLFSPACASFDQYENYKQRGKDFVSSVHFNSKKEKYNV